MDRKSYDFWDIVIVKDIENSLSGSVSRGQTPWNTVRKEEILSAVVKSGRSYEEIMNFLNAGSDGEKTEK